MPQPLPAGPYRTVVSPDGARFPYYIIPFDKEGRCEGPATRNHLVDSVAKGDFTHIFLFSHGWNNDWKAATTRYEEFINGFMAMRRKQGLPLPQPFKPLLVGVFWPSTALVFFEDEVGPQIAAAGDPDAQDEATGLWNDAVREIAADLPAAHVERFRLLMQQSDLTDDEARELAAMSAGLSSRDDEVRVDEKVSAEATFQSWLRTSAPPPDFDDFGIGDDLGVAGGPQAAGAVDLIRRIPVRMALRTFTVFQMKDRAGVVGSKGVGPLLRDLLSAGDARIYLIGHSFGAKVMLSAVSARAALPRPVEGMLLLQPAVSHLCFAEHVTGAGRAGGYRVALNRVVLPILSTYSDQDGPLHTWFHWILMRDQDLGEPMAAAGKEPPNRFAALGGYGPRDAGETLVDILDPTSRYDLAGGSRILGIDGSRTISGHGEINNPTTWWALYCLLTGGRN